MEEIIQKVASNESSHLQRIETLLIPLNQLKEVVECVRQLQGTQVERTSKEIEDLGGSEQKSSIESSNDPEVKEVPPYLKDVFLGEQ